MQETSTAILASNLADDKTLQQYLLRNKVSVISRVGLINTKESLVISFESTKADFLFIPSSIPGVISLNEVFSKIKQLSPRTKIILVSSGTGLEKITDHIVAGVDAVIYLENLLGSLEYAFKQLVKGQMFLCGIALGQLKTDVLKNRVSDVITNTGLLEMLTDRELEVLYSLTQGVNYKQIAIVLFISESTVKPHINNIFTKLNVSDRTQAVLYALHHGISSLVKKPSILQAIVGATVSS